MSYYSQFPKFKAEDVTDKLPSYSLRELAQAIVQQYVIQSRENTQIIMDEIIQNYCIMTATKYSDFEKLDIEAKCDALFTWCRKTYSDHFRNHYKLNKKKFVDCLLGRSKPTDDLIIQLSIAFKLTPDLCDDFLNYYGYLKLHPKNIYHLSIYSVLKIYTPKDGKYDQYDVVKKRYEFAKTVVNQAKITEEQLWKANATTLLQSIVDARTVWTDERFEEFIRQYAEELNGYQNSLLREHTELTKIFRDLYNEKSKGMQWDETVTPYSLFAFSTDFCGILPNHFKESLVSSIRSKESGKDKQKKKDDDKDTVKYTGKYPTRQAMILLWLFENCFKGFEIHNCPDKYIQENQLKRKTKIIYSGVFGNDCCDFSIEYHLYGTASKSHHEWNGPDARTLINDNLMFYDWNAITKDDLFDYLIYSFLNFKISRSKDGRRVVTHTQKDLFPQKTVKIDRIDDGQELSFDYDVPEALQLLFALMSLVQSEYHDRMSKSLVDPVQQTAVVELFDAIDQQYLASGVLDTLDDSAFLKRLLGEELLWDEMDWATFESSITDTEFTFDTLFAARDVIAEQIDWITTNELPQDLDASNLEKAQQMLLGFVKQLNRIVSYIDALDKGISYPLQCTLYYKIDI